MMAEKSEFYTFFAMVSERKLGNRQYALQQAMKI